MSTSLERARKAATNSTDSYKESNRRQPRQNEGESSEEPREKAVKEEGGVENLPRKADTCFAQRRKLSL